MRRIRTPALLVCFTISIGCAARRDLGPGSVGSPGSATSAPAAVAITLMSNADRERLGAVAAERANAPGDRGYVIGPDDLLDIRIPDLLDVPAQAIGIPPVLRGDGVAPAVAQAPVFQQGFRVNELGEVTFPLLGAVRAAGLTPTALEQEIAQRLVASRLLRRPQVTVLVAEYRSRVVAVVGSVERPGLYPLTRPGATLADLIWAAGGPNKDAGRMIAFVPASGPAPVPGAPPNLERLARGDPISIDLEFLLHPDGSSMALDPPVRSGDLISISPAGNVHVDGWVEKPGSYPITRALTLSGAVAAAGGQLFAADCHRVTVKRLLGPNHQQQFTVDLKEVAAGRVADLTMADGDVVQIPPSFPRLVPYGTWELVKALVHVGGTFPIF